MLKAIEYSMLTHALGYAGRGWPVFPLHSVYDGRCSCGRLQCPNAGKHPRLQNGLKGATLDASTIERWWKRWPIANIGIRTGLGLMVLDVDVAKGGDDSLENLAEKGELGDTLTVQTGGGGYHWYFASDKPIKCSVSKLAPGIDVRGEGGYVVAPPSTHVSGDQYVWEGLIDAHLGDGIVNKCPPWLLALASSRPSRSDVDPYRAQAFIASTRNNALTSMAGTIRRRGAGHESILALLRAMNASKCRPPLDDTEVVRIARSVAKYEPADPILGTVERHGDTSNDDDSWRKALVSTKEGKLSKTAGNAALLMLHGIGWEGCLAHNAFAGEMEWIKRPPGLPGADVLTPPIGALSDCHTVYLQQWIAHTHGITIGRESLWQALRAVAMIHDVHPVRDWIESIEWDGEPRVNKWLSTYMGSEPDEYADDMGQAWLVSAIARIMRPGCQADHVLVLEGGQGTGKSTAMRTLFGDEWFLDCLPDIRHKDALMVMRGKWGIEVAELDSFRGAAETRIKSFITQRVDEYRPSHERQVVRYPRQCVIVGTTNEENWLTDSTGGRRFWPVKVGRIDYKKLEKDRAQLWAEAAQLYNGGAVWWPKGKLAAMAKQAQSERFTEDVWQDLIAASNSSNLDADYIYRHILNIESGRITKSDQVRIGSIMRRMGYTKIRRRRDGVRITAYEKSSGDS